jgi:putative membrane protein
MAYFRDAFVLIVALEAFFIMVLEMIGTQTRVARKAFDLSKEYLSTKEARSSMANQGLYNGFIGVGLLYARYGLVGSASYSTQLLFVGFVVIAAIFGALTANKKIIVTQGAPAILALLFLLLSH